jgi:hypothetical protein
MLPSLSSLNSWSILSHGNLLVLANDAVGFTPRAIHGTKRIAGASVRQDLLLLPEREREGKTITALCSIKQSSL